MLPTVSNARRDTGIACCALMLGMGLVAGCSRRSDDGSSAEPPKGNVAVIASCDTQGWIEPCGCASGQSGGLARRATLARQLATDADALLVSVGGATSGTKPYDVEKLRAIVAGESAMGYAVHNIGPEELFIGIDRIGGASDLVFVSTNTFQPDNHSAKPSVVVRRAGWRILVLGVIQPELAAGALVDEPDTAILKELEARQGQYDAAIVLAYMDETAIRELSEKLPEVDVVIGGKTNQSMAPQKMGQTLLTAVSNKGKFIARVSGTPVSDSRLAWQADLHEVSSELEEDAAQLQNLKSFRTSLGNFDFSAQETSFVPMRLNEGAESAASFAGSESCTSCHDQDQEVWIHSAHAHAWKTLEEVGAHVDSSCQRCHTTGFGLTGGFTNRAMSMDRIEVGCESCHGPSSAHVEDETMPTPWQASQSCVVCHDKENSPHFEYDSYWQQVIHGPTPKVTDPESEATQPRGEEPHSKQPAAPDEPTVSTENDNAEA